MGTRQNKPHKIFHNRASGFFRCTNGTTSVEFALVIGAVLLLIFGIIEFGRAMHTRNAVEALADLAARTALLNPDCELDPDDLLNLQAHGNGLQSDRLTIIAPNAANGYELRIDYEFALTLPLMTTSLTSLKARKGIASLCGS